MSLLKQANDQLRDLERKISDAKNQVKELYEIMPDESVNDKEFLQLYFALKSNIEAM